MRTSWLDWLTDRMDAVPGPRWLVYAGVLTVLIVLNGLFDWALALRSFPAVVLSPVVAVTIPLAMLWAMQSLDRVALAALAEVRPALDVTDAEAAVNAQELTGTPPGWAVVAIPIGLAAGLGSVFGSPSGWELLQGDPGLAWARTLILASINTIIATGFLIHVVHQLRVVGALHRRVVAIDLFRLQPLYAFAKLTSLTGGLLIVIGVGSFPLGSLIVPTFVLSPTDFLTLGAILVVGFACFIVPLQGLHDRISAERDRRLAEAHATLSATLAEVRLRVAAGDFDGTARLNDAVAAANTGVQVVSRVSTWPWRPETLRGFLSAVFLPILLWLVITILGRFLPT